MDFKDLKKYALQGVEVIKLDSKTMEKLAKDEKATSYALLIVALVGLAQAIGTFNIPGVIILPIVTVIGSFVGVGIMHVLAKLFGGKAKFMEFYRTFGIGYVGMWISVIPILGPILSGILGLWYFVVNVMILKAVHKLSTVKAVIVMLIPVIIVTVLAFMLAAVFVALFAGMLGGSVPDLGNFNLPY